METYNIIIVALVIGLGLLYIIKAVYEAENDPETFDKFKEEAKFRKPSNWKKGVMPETSKKKGQLEDTKGVTKE